MSITQSVGEKIVLQMALLTFIHSDTSPRRPFRQGAGEEPAEQPGSAVSRLHREQRSLRGWLVLMSLCRGQPVHIHALDHIDAAGQHRIVRVAVVIEKTLDFI